MIIWTEKKNLAFHSFSKDPFVVDIHARYYFAFVTYALLKSSFVSLIQSNCSLVSTKLQTHIWKEQSLHPLLCMYTHGIIILHAFFTSKCSKHILELFMHTWLHGWASFSSFVHMCTKLSCSNDAFHYSSKIAELGNTGGRAVC